MSDEQATPETKGVTADLLAAVDLGPEIEGMAGRQLRLRMFTFEPGGEQVTYLDLIYDTHPIRASAGNKYEL